MPPTIKKQTAPPPARDARNGSSHATMTAPKMSRDDFDDLLKTMQVDATMRLVDYFYGARLVYDAGLAQKLVGRISSSLGQQMSTSRGHAAVEGGRMLQMLYSLIGDIMDSVQKAMGATASAGGVSGAVGAAVKDRAVELATSAFGASFVASATPVVSLIPDAYKALSKNYAAIDGIVKAVQASRYAEAVKVGSPRAAADAVGLILKRKAAYLSTQAATSLVNLSASIATVASTGMSAGVEIGIKLATAITDFVAELTMFAIEMWEFSAGERLLTTINGFDHQLLIEDDFAEDLFPAAYDVCPLLGSYMLASAPYFNTSDFVALAAGPGMLASVDEVQRIAVKNVNPLRLYASQIIVESKIRLRHDHRSDINEVMSQAGLRAQAVEAQSLKGRAKKALSSHIAEPLKKKWATLRA